MNFRSLRKTILLIGEHMARLGDRNKSFKRFYDDSKATFEGFFQKDASANELAQFFTFYVAPGGSGFAKDDRVVEIFFGNRALGATQQLAFGPLGFPTARRVTTTESGAHLIYERTDAGTVLVTLYPASTDTLKQREEFIVLGWIRSPHSICSKKVHRQHWNAFVSYMQCTSVDGMPTFVDRCRVAWMRFTKPMSIDKKIEGRRVSRAASTVLQYVLTIGLSGFLFSLVSLWESAGQDSQIRNERDALIRDAERWRVTTEMLNHRIESLESKLAKLQEPDTATQNADSASRRAHLPVQGVRARDTNRSEISLKTR